MKIAASILDCKSRIEGVVSLNRTKTSYIHIDVMDGKFVPSVEFSNMNEISGVNLVSKYPLDVHLMVDSPLDYIKDLGGMNIEFITVHLEIDKDKREIFKRIRKLGYKVGLSIKPNTDVKQIVDYLDDIDLVLVMSVEPGMGGQKFIDSTVDRIIELKKLIGDRNITVEVDGGINIDTIDKVRDIVDIAVVGSYITKSDNYYKSILNLLESKKNDVSVIKDNDNKTNSSYIFNGIIVGTVIGLGISLLIYAFFNGISLKIGEFNGDYSLVRLSYLGCFFIGLGIVLMSTFFDKNNYNSWSVTALKKKRILWRVLFGIGTLPFAYVYGVSLVALYSFMPVHEAVWYLLIFAFITWILVSFFFSCFVLVVLITGWPVFVFAGSITLSVTSFIKLKKINKFILKNTVN